MSKTQFDPDYVSHPGETLKDILKIRGMMPSFLAITADLEIGYIYDLIDGQQNAIITKEIALKFAKILGTPASFWINREKRYRELLAKKEVKNDLSNNN